MDKLQVFLRVFEIPPFVKPWIDRFFEEIEIDLVMRLANGPLRREEINRAFLSRFKPDPSDANSDLTTRAHRKGIINLRDDNRFEPADFHTRFDKWSMFEGWKDIPDEIRNQLNAWELAHYEKQHANQISMLRKGQSREPSLIYPEYILLHEAETLLELAMYIYLMPCNCRSMLNNCAQSVYTCLRFENDRGVGWEISKSRAKNIVNLANKNGLMQNGEVAITDDGNIRGAICNCCPDCCFPHKLADHRNAQNLWPLSRYVARYLKDRCIACGRCTKRCPFQAFTFEKSRASTSPSKSILFNEKLCRGCGVCSTGCPEEAIEMTAIECSQSLMNEILKRR
ncbi:MAG: 4Fe-4S binding protein [Desulfobacterales bacterium]|jgi:Pyruvate/2-oxoacid:ferredoxin oxidoreductase delta subunit